ncbi:MAG: response regulator, partial [Defluviitaleaceae bacterium]|nr:response regulator [Defluviitaleaceae bacterium]
MDKAKNTVLIIDDDRSNIAALTEMLNAEYKVLAVKDSKLAIKTAVKSMPDIILLDILMPEPDGYEVIAGLKNNELTNGIPVIFITGLDDMYSEQKGLQSGGADYIFKPFNSASVKLRIKNQIALVERVKQQVYFQNLSDMLSEITKSHTVNSDTLDAAASAIAKAGCAALKASVIGIWKFSESPYVLENIVSFKETDETVTVREDLNLFGFNEYIDRLNSERLFTMDCAGEYRPVMGDDFSASALDSPIWVNGSLFGVICVEQERRGAETSKRQWLIEEQNFVSSLADLTALAASGFELRKSREKTETENRAKASILANMSREIRTPMNAIIGVTDSLMQTADLPSEIEDGLHWIYNSCDMLLGIINDISDFSSTEDGKLDIMPARYKVADLLNDAVKQNMMRIYGKPIEFDIQIDENIPSNLIGDVLRIKQILNNLLSNAFKFTENGKVSLTAVSETLPNEDGVTLILVVRDTGCGMTEQQIKNIFSDRQ